METSLCVVSMVPWSGASGAMLSLSDHKHHLVQAFPLQMKKLRCREGGVLAYSLQSVPSPFSFLIVLESGSGMWGVALISILCLREQDWSVAGGLAQDPRAQGNLEEALCGGAVVVVQGLDLP